MFVGFDRYNKYEKPTLILAMPSKAYVGALGNAYGIRLEMNYNDLSILTFSVPQKVDGQSTPNYNLIVGKKLVLVENVGWFKLENPTISSDGKIEVKECTAYSLETEFRQKNITAMQGTFEFYNPVTPLTSLMGIILSEIPSWSIGTIDTSLWTVFRTFDVEEDNLYSFMMESVAQAFECVFTFDTFTKKINATKLSNVGKDTSIFLSFDNLLKVIDIEERSEEIVTALKVYGGNDLSIRSVNPNGTDTIYNFNYFKNTNWMSQSLITALDAYQVKYNSLTPTYQTNLSNLKIKSAELLALEGQLFDLQTQLNSLEDIQKTRIQGGLNYSDIYSQITSKESQIDTKESQISGKKSEITAINNTLANLNSQLSWANNFTLAQIQELDTVTIEDTYQDNSFITTDVMDEDKKVAVAQELYDFGASVLSRVAQPRYTFTINSANFAFIKEFENFTGQLDLGSLVTLSIREDYTIKPVLLKVVYNFEEDTEFELTFGNRFKLDGEFLLEDILNTAVKGGSSLSFEKFAYSDWNRNSKDEVTTFINSALDASKNMIISAETQDVIINNNGIRLRQSNGTGGFLNEQLWIVNNMIALSDNGFQTAKMAIGKLQDTNLGSVFGICAPLLVGTMIAGNSLLITNQNNKFRVDATGATLTDASFTLTTTNNKGKIILDPNIGIKIQGNSGGSFTDKFYVDTSGNVIFSGNLSGAGGTFSGTLNAATINASTINGGYISAATFSVPSISGGTITGTNISAVNITGSSTITGGTINGGIINGATINGGTINVSSEVNIGKQLIINSNDFDAGIRWGGTSASIYYDPGSGGIFAKGNRIDVPSTARFV